jgi:hypothetical protein
VLSHAGDVCLLGVTAVPCAAVFVSSVSRRGAARRRRHFAEQKFAWAPPPPRRPPASRERARGAVARVTRCLGDRNHSLRALRCDERRGAAANYVYHAGCCGGLLGAVVIGQHLVLRHIWHRDLSLTVLSLYLVASTSRNLSTCYVFRMNSLLVSYSPLAEWVFVFYQLWCMSHAGMFACLEVTTPPVRRGVRVECL